MEISGKTALTALIGSPVSHSISPKMHNLAFKLLGIDCVYLAFDIGSSDLAAAVRGLKEIGIVGFNVTMPYKEQVMEYMDDLTDAALLAGSCNTVTVRDGHMTGHTTDGEGFMRSVKDYGYDITGKKLTLLGAGGAARAILSQAALDGVAAIDIFRRDNSPAFAETVRLADMIERSTGCALTVFDFADRAQLSQSISESAMLVNATSVGMAPGVDACPIPDASYLRPDLFVYDIIYNPRETRLTKMARDAGCMVSNGVSMILFQGAASFQCWTGREMPVDLIRESVFAS